MIEAMFPTLPKIELVRPRRSAGGMAGGGQRGGGRVTGIADALATRAQATPDQTERADAAIEATCSKRRSASSSRSVFRGTLRRANRPRDEPLPHCERHGLQTADWQAKAEEWLMKTSAT